MVRELNNRVLLLILPVLLFSCGEDGATLLQKSQDAHGGLDSYKSLKTINYNKKTILYDSSGNVELEVLQEHKYLYGENYSGMISWGNEIPQRVEFNGEEVQKWVNELQIVDEEQLAAAMELVNSSQYVLFQPFRLSDPGTRISVTKMKWPGTDRVYTALKPEYQNSEDEWWFYLDPDSYRVIANLVKHNGRYSFIENLEFDNTTILLLHSHRKSYFTDSTLSSRLLRAEYFYTDYYLQ